MTDQPQTIPAGLTREEARAVREWALHALNKPGASTTAEKAVARVVIGTVPEPRPTLADMTDEERAACQWMQADVEGYGTRCVIASLHDDDDDTGLVPADGGIVWAPPDTVTPRTDLPRLEWPGTEPEAGDVPPVKVGDVIESADDPRIPALPIGSILLDRDGDTVTKERETWTGPGCIPIPPYGDKFGPWTVLHVGRGADQ